jgi:hypothetical protein
MSSQRSKRVAADVPFDEGGTSSQRQKCLPLLAPDEKIDVWERLRLIFLCSNQALGEIGVSRVIAGFYKDLLAEEVLADMDNKFCESSAAILTHADSSLDILFYYMKNFVKNRLVYHRGLEFCRTTARHHIREGYDVNIVLDAVMAGAFIHKDFDTQSDLLTTLAKWMPDSWSSSTTLFQPNTRLTDMMTGFLDRDGADVLLQDFTRFAKYHETCDLWGLITLLENRRLLLRRVISLFAAGLLQDYLHLRPRMDATLDQDERECIRIRQLVRPISP